MTAEKLSNLQLLMLSKNKANNSFIRKLAATEFEKRSISSDEMHDLLIIQNLQNKTGKQIPFPKYAKILILVFAPITCSHIIIMILQNIFAAVLLDKGYFKMEKQYWLFATISYFVWTAILLFFIKVLS
jgi:hypothetical protein